MIEGVVVDRGTDGRYLIESYHKHGTREKKMTEESLESLVVDDFVEFGNRDCTISDLIQRLHDNYGSVPIFCFGFSKMQRGMSFRSDDRVPTHMIHAFGAGYSIDKTLQSLGRATYVGKDLLHKNGFDHVVILSSRSDLEASTAYQRFMIALHKRLEQGDALIEALDGSKELLPHECDFFRFTCRYDPRFAPLVHTYVAHSFYASFPGNWEKSKACVDFTTTMRLKSAGNSIQSSANVRMSFGGMSLPKG